MLTRTSCSRRAQAEETFDWAQQWYPLFFVADLSTDKPTPTQLLGKDLVLWRAPDGAWSALEDLCPHRLAPLSRAPPRSPLTQAAAGCLACWYQSESSRWVLSPSRESKHIPSVRFGIRLCHCANCRRRAGLRASVLPCQDSLLLCRLMAFSVLAVSPRQLRDAAHVCAEGRVEGGTLHCSYHGWRFDAGGNCTCALLPPCLRARTGATWRCCRHGPPS